MEEFLREFAAWLTKEISVDLLDVWVVVRLTDRLAFIDLVEDVGTFGAISIKDIGTFALKEGWLDEWLTTAVDAAAWAAHDLDEGIWGVAGFDLL